MRSEAGTTRPSGSLLWRRFAVLIAAAVLGATVGSGLDEAMRGVIAGAAFGVIVAASLREL